MKKDSALTFGHCKRTSVPEDVVGTDRLFDPAQERFDSERDDDLAVVLLRLILFAGANSVVPLAIEVCPIVAAELRPRVLGERTIDIDLTLPTCLGGNVIAYCLLSN